VEDGGELARRRGQVVETVALQAALPVELGEPRSELLVGGRILEVARDVVERLGERLPVARLDPAARELRQRRADLGPEAIRIPPSAR